MNAFWRWTRTPFQEIEFGDRRTYETCLLLVRVVYAFVFSLLFLSVWEGGMREWSLADKEVLWPAEWLGRFEWDRAATLVPVVTWLAALVAVWFPQRLVPRVLAFAGLLCFKAAHFSHQGKIDHNYHTLLATLFVFLFLPRVVEGSPREAERRDAYCRVFWGAQALVLLTYTLAGFSKLLGAAVAIRFGEVSALHPDAMGLHIAANWGRSKDLLLGRVMATNVPLGWSSFVASIWFETFALVAAFRPRIHRLWGGALVAFHVGVMLSMGIVFLETSIVLLLLLCLSPFAPRRWRAEPALAAVPWLGPALAAVWARLAPRREGDELRCFADGSSACGRRLAEVAERHGPVPGTSVETFGSEGYAELRRELGDRHPSRAFLVAVRRTGDGRVLLVNAAASLRLLLARRGWRAAWVVPLLLVPGPLLDAGARRWCRSL